MPAATWVALGLLVVLALLVVVVVRRMSAVMARARELERFQAATALLDARFTSTVDALVTRLDEIRHRSGDAVALAAWLPDASDRLRAVAADATRLAPPPGLRETASRLTEEVERAIRSSELAQHGLAALGDARRPGDAEGHTELKRAELNLRHARERFAAATARVAALTPRDLARHAGGDGDPERIEARM